MPSKRPSTPFKRLATRLMATLVTLGAAAAAAVQAAEPLKISYSDWPGWVAWQVAIDKGWFKEAGVDVKFECSTTRPRWTPTPQASLMLC